MLEVIQFYTGAFAVFYGLLIGPIYDLFGRAPQWNEATFYLVVSLWLLEGAI